MDMRNTNSTDIAALAATSDDLPGDASYLAARKVGLSETQSSLYAEGREAGMAAQDALRRSFWYAR